MRTLRLLIPLFLFVFLNSTTGWAEDNKASSPVFSMREATEIEQKIQNALSGACRAQIIFQDNTLREAFQYLMDVHDIPIYPEYLDEYDISIDDTRVILEMSDCTLEDVLTVLCEKASLAFIIEDSLLKIVPEKVAESRFVTVVYDLGAFADVGYPIEDISSVLRKTVAPDSWDSSDLADVRVRSPNFVSNQRLPTNAAIKSGQLHLTKGAIEPVSNGVVVYQTQPVHREIQQVLRQLWMVAKRRQDAKTSEADPTTVRTPKQDS